MVDADLDWAMVERDLLVAEDDDVVFQKSPDELNSTQEMNEGRSAEKTVGKYLVIVLTPVECLSPTCF